MPEYDVGGAIPTAFDRTTEYTEYTEYPYHNSLPYLLGDFESFIILIIIMIVLLLILPHDQNNAVRSHPS